MGFPDIKLLEPLADALEITIVELKQSKMIEDDLPKEKAAELVSDTVNTIQKQGELSRKRKLILYGGNCVIFAVYSFLHILGQMYDFEPRWVGAALVMIAIFVWHWGSRALYCLLTGEAFFRKVEYTRQEKIAQTVFLISAIVLIALLTVFGRAENVWRDFLIVICLAAIVGSGMLLKEE